MEYLIIIYKIINRNYMFKFSKKSLVPNFAKNLPGIQRKSTIIDGQMSARNTESFSLVLDNEKHEKGLRSSRHDLNNSMSFELGMDKEDYINDGYFGVKMGLEKEPN
jgi:hypothetical protein